MGHITNTGYFPLRFYHNGTYFILHPDTLGHWIYTSKDAETISNWKTGLGITFALLIIIIILLTITKLCQACKTTVDILHIDNISNSNSINSDAFFKQKSDYNKEVAGSTCDTHIVLDDSYDSTFVAMSQPLLSKDSTML